MGEGPAEVGLCQGTKKSMLPPRRGFGAETCSGHLPGEAPFKGAHKPPPPTKAGEEAVSPPCARPCSPAPEGFQDGHSRG